ncbi:MAG: cytochrome c biogenesis heme-transporting ATPase CcmA [Gammaproteobacteria bacterium]
MLEAVDISCLKGYRLLFSGLGFRLESGEMLHIAGPNGAGKTSLLRILCGLAMPDSGEVCWQGCGIGRNRDGFHRSLYYLGHAPALSRDLTVLENMQHACLVAGDDVGRTDCMQALEQSGLGDCMHLPVRLLSEGQRRQAALSRLYLSGCRRLWLLDEPFSVLDDVATQELGRLLCAQCHAGGIVILTTHRPVILERQPRVVTLGDGAGK